MSRKIVVTGAFSYTGKYITRRLLDQGCEVITLTGHPDRPDPFGGKVQVFPFNFEDLTALSNSLKGVTTLYNTYWVRFGRGANTHERAVVYTRRLIHAAEAAGVKRIVHVSITNPDIHSPLPYFRGKALLEEAIHASQLSYAILRPTVLFGAEDILINNIAFLLRRFPFFIIPGYGRYWLQPIYVEDFADLAVAAGNRRDNSIQDAAGTDAFTFEEMVRLIAARIRRPARLVHLPPRLALLASQVVSMFVGDVVLTQDEVKGLMAGLLVSKETPLGEKRLGDWLEANQEQVGMRYASELTRHYK